MSFVYIMIGWQLSVDNRLSLQLGNTECILFGTKEKLSLVHDLYIECNDHTIDSTDKVEYLGVFNWSIF